MIQIWAGTELSYQLVLDAKAKVEAGLAIKAGYLPARRLFGRYWAIRVPVLDAWLTDPAKQREPMPGKPAREPEAHPPPTPAPDLAPMGPEDFDPEVDVLDADDDGIKVEDFYIAKTRKEVYAARLARLKFRQLDGQLVESDQVQAEWQKIVTAVKTRMLSVPSKVRARVPHMTLSDMATMEEEIRAALEELSGAGGP